MKQLNIQTPFRMFVLLLGLFLSVGAFAQIDVKGHVKDAQGEPIIGATVRVANTQIATVSDFDGNFALKANQGADITISYIGYQTQTVKAAPNLEITLHDDASGECGSHRLWSCKEKRLNWFGNRHEARRNE